MGCLLSIPIILLFILIFFGTAVLRIIQTIFRGKPASSYGQNSKTDSQTYRQRQEENSTGYESVSDPAYRRWPHVSRHKIFGKDEGEYVDFEEITEDSNR